MKVGAKAQRGMRFIARVVAGLLAEPATARTIKERHRIADPALSRLLRRLCTLRVLAPIDLEPTPRGPAARVYGVCEKSPLPPVRMTKRGFPSRNNLIRSKVEPSAPVTSFAAIWHALQERQSVADLQAAGGCSNDAVWALVHEMRRLKIIGRRDWDTSAVPWRELFVRGCKRDAPRPAPAPDTERNRRGRERRKALLLPPGYRATLCANSSIFNLAGAA